VIVSPTVETFSGTLANGGIATHTFVVNRSNGQLDVTLRQVGTASPVVMGLGVGTPSDSGCTFISGASIGTVPGSTPQLSGSISAGNYCVSIYDVGNLTAPATYTIVVSHY
jgi:hypothetical protein